MLLTTLLLASAVAASPDDPAPELLAVHSLDQSPRGLEWHTNILLPRAPPGAPSFRELPFAVPLPPDYSFRGESSQGLYVRRDEEGRAHGLYLDLRELFPRVTLSPDGTRFGVDSVQSPALTGLAPPLLAGAAQRIDVHAGADLELRPDPALGLERRLDSISAPALGPRDRARLDATFGRGHRLTPQPSIYLRADPAQLAATSGRVAELRPLAERRRGAGLRVFAAFAAALAVLGALTLALRRRAGAEEARLLLADDDARLGARFDRLDHRP